MDGFLPYIAGFFDGEGSIGIYRGGSTQGRTLRVQLTQNATVPSTMLLLECQRRWGGSLCPMNPSGKRVAWNWQASASSGIRALTDMRPHLRLKAQEADMALDWWATRPKPRRSPSGRILPFTAAEREADSTAEMALKSAKRGATRSWTIRLRGGGSLVAISHTFTQRGTLEID
jgi:hypothetical protein